MLPDIVRGKFLGEHLLDLIRQRVCRTQDDIRILLLHILGVRGQKFLPVTVTVDVRAAGELNKAADVAVVGSDNV